MLVDERSEWKVYGHIDDARYRNGVVNEEELVHKVYAGTPESFDSTSAAPC